MSLIPLPDGLTGWELRLVWPITDDTMLHSEAIEAARARLPAAADQLEAVVVGEARFWVAAANPTDPRIATPTVVRCVAAAVPTWRHWQDVVEELAGKGWSDPRIAALLHVKVDRIRGLRRRHGIAPGVPAGWASVNAERWAAA